MNNVIVLMGPTASGKSCASIELAKKVNGEIISADSMQIYRKMDIGTAKLRLNEMQGIPHHMIDVVGIDEAFSVALFKQKAEACIKEIHEKDKLPIVAGGTGLYINALIYNINFNEVFSDPEIREKLFKEAAEYGNEHLHQKLQTVDPIAASNIHPNNLKRVIRALEVYQLSGKPISMHQDESRSVPPPYCYILIGLQVDRQLLYDRIEQRVDRMVESGLVREVRHILSEGYPRELVSLQGLGYKEIAAYLEGECALPDAIERIKLNTKHFAKRQMTWFNKIENVHWIDADHGDAGEIVENIKDYVASFGIIL